MLDNFCFATTLAFDYGVKQASIIRGPGESRIVMKLFATIGSCSAIHTKSECVVDQPSLSPA